MAVKSQLGGIKCTYAEIYGKDGRKLYSLQARDFCLSKRYPFYRPLEWQAQKGWTRVMLTEPALQFIGDTSDVELPEEIYAKECAIDWVKPVSGKRTAIFAAVLAGVFYFLKKGKKI